MASPWSRCGKRHTSRVWSLIAFCMLDHPRPPLSYQEHTHCDVKSICPALKVYISVQPDPPSKYWTIETFSPYKNQMARYLYRGQRDGDQVSIKTVFFGPKSDHCLALSVPKSLTTALSQCSLWDLTDMTLACEDSHNLSLPYQLWQPCCWCQIKTKATLLTLEQNKCIAKGTMKSRDIRFLIADKTSPRSYLTQVWVINLDERNKRKQVSKSFTTWPHLKVEIMHIVCIIITLIAHIIIILIVVIIINMCGLWLDLPWLDGATTHVHIIILRALIRVCVNCIMTLHSTYLIAKYHYLKLEWLCVQSVCVWGVDKGGLLNKGLIFF